MKFAEKLVLNSGFTFDYTNMFGTGRLQEADLTALEGDMQKAAAAVDEMRRSGTAYKHLSKDGTPEPVYFTRFADIENGNPNTPVSLQKLKEFGDYLRTNVDAVVFLGIGGSYLGNKVLFDIGAGPSWNSLGEKRRSGYPRIYFSGNNLDAGQCEEIMNELRYWSVHAWPKKKRFKVMLVPISKSGSTLETLASFIYFYEACNKSVMFDTEVTAVTDRNPEAGSPLFTLAEKHGWRCFDIKNGIGGRFSVLTDPGLVTAAAIGMNVEELLSGAGNMEAACRSENIYENPALMNAALKYLAAAKYGCHIEVFMGYGERLGSLGQWYVQLLAESLGKRQNRSGETVYYGRTPVPAVGTTDMHAQTQLHQDGIRNKVVQFLQIKNMPGDIVLGMPFDEPVFKKYHGLKMNEALAMALDSNAEALNSDNRFNARYVLPEMNAYHLGELFYFLMLSIAYEGELANIDAFDQPGVETYKKIMKAKFANLPQKN